ncbi:MAG: LysM peptidoglycan-binding domain-containing protein, partial [Rhodobacteraceae bacterium]|nr:LysM peptidoglycan-binding domain-containing protein [Paracoccaceae bacterium]
MIGAAACTQGVGAGGSASVVPNAAPDSRGVITYATYQVAVAQNGDTMATVATRVGTTPEALASRNALPLDYRLRAGEVLLLPDSVPRPTGSALTTGDVSTSPLGWSPEQASAAINGAPGNPPAGNPFQNGQSDPLIDPVRHRVEAGETAYSIA